MVAARLRGLSWAGRAAAQQPLRRSQHPAFYQRGRYKLHAPAFMSKGEARTREGKNPKAARPATARAQQASLPAKAGWESPGLVLLSFLSGLQPRNTIPVASVRTALFLPLPSSSTVMYEAREESQLGVSGEKGAAGEGAEPNISARTQSHVLPRREPASEQGKPTVERGINLTKVSHCLKNG